MRAHAARGHAFNRSRRLTEHKNDVLHISDMSVVKEQLIHNILPKEKHPVEANGPQRSSHEQAKPIDYWNY